MEHRVLSPDDEHEYTPEEMEEMDLIAEWLESLDLADMQCLKRYWDSMNPNTRAH